MKREKRLTKREMKAAQRSTGQAVVPTTARHQEKHIHCIACGRHLDPGIFGEPDGASFARCDHGTEFAHCNACVDKAKLLIVEHDGSGKPLQTAAVWH